MLYFIVIPAFVLWLVAAAMAVGMTKAVPRIAYAFPYVWRVSLWATLGFIAANALLIVLLAGGMFALDGASTEKTVSGGAVRMLWGVGALAGPLVASATGWFFGAVFGAALSLRHHRSSARQMQQDGSRRLS
jgi:hypothetical protein